MESQYCTWECCHLLNCKPTRFHNSTFSGSTSLIADALDAANVELSAYSHTHVWTLLDLSLWRSYSSYACCPNSCDCSYTAVQLHCPVQKTLFLCHTPPLALRLFLFLKHWESGVLAEHNLSVLNCTDHVIITQKLYYSQDCLANSLSIFLAYTYILY